MAGMRAALALVAACVVACVVVVTLSGSNGPVALLEGKAHAAHKSPVMTALKETKAETLASAAQARLAKKDSRIFKSMALAAEKKDRETAVEDRKFLAARQTQIELDERLQQLTQRFEAQRKALAYMKPRVMMRDQETQKLGSYVKQLAHVIPQLGYDMSKVHKSIVKTLEEAKPAREEMRTAEDMLAKSENAYNLFAQRMQASREKGSLARQQEEELNYGALRSQQQATQLRQYANEADNTRRAGVIAEDAKVADSRVAMLNKQSTEAMQSAQLFDAEADEAASYMAMFGADAVQSKARLQGAGNKLKYLAAEYEKGTMLQRQANGKELMLMNALARAKEALARSENVDKEDESAVQTGIKATEQTEQEIGHVHAEAVGNTRAALKDLASARHDRFQGQVKGMLAENLKQEAIAHDAAALHLKEAAQASSSVVEDDSK